MSVFLPCAVLQDFYISCDWIIGVLKIQTADLLSAAVNIDRFLRTDGYVGEILSIVQFRFALLQLLFRGNCAGTGYILCFITDGMAKEQRSKRDEQDGG